MTTQNEELTLTIIGNAEFNLGFRLAGVQNIITLEKLEKKDEVDEIINKQMQEKFEGIVVVDDEASTHINERTKEDMNNSITPIYISVTKKQEQEELRKMILQSIGVDLLKDEE